MMYEKFKYERIALSLIRLDKRNPRIVTQEPLDDESAIVSYLFEHEDLASFVKLIATEGRNPGAERPYVVKEGKSYIVVEGNTRVAAYKLLTGQCLPPPAFAAAVPLVHQSVKDELVSVDVAIAPSRDALMTIMARAHFGRGDKSKWGYLGSRKVVYDDWRSGKSISHLSAVFSRPQAQIKDLIIDYMLYLEALKFDWTEAERDILLRPSIEFNPPVRFLQTVGHKKRVGIDFDRVNIAVKFTDNEGPAKLKHLIKRTVIDEGGPTATASYDEVFESFKPAVAPASQHTSSSSVGSDNAVAESVIDATASPATANEPNNEAAGVNSETQNGLKPNALFSYPVKRNDLTLTQLMKEAKGLNTKSYPAAGSALLRSIIEVLLKLIIEDKGLNPQGARHDLESALNLVRGKAGLAHDDLNVLKEFQKTYLSYMNLSSHATIVPNHHRLMMARDCIDAFVKRNV